MNGVLWPFKNLVDSDNSLSKYSKCFYLETHLGGAAEMTKSQNVTISKNVGSFV